MFFPKEWSLGIITLHSEACFPKSVAPRHHLWAIRCHKWSLGTTHDVVKPICTRTWSLGSILKILIPSWFLYRNYFMKILEKKRRDENIFLIMCTQERVICFSFSSFLHLFLSFLSLFWNHVLFLFCFGWLFHYELKPIFLGWRYRLTIMVWFWIYEI